MGKHVQRIREMAKQQGVSGLTDTDLLMLLLPAKQVSLVEEMYPKLHELLKRDASLARPFTIAELFDGENLPPELNEESRLLLQAALEVARRVVKPPVQGYKIGSPEDVYRLVEADMRYRSTEQMRVLLLDMKNIVLAERVVYEGTVSEISLRLSEALRPAITRNAPAIILCHNHPSGNATPTPEDCNVTRLLAKAGELLDIKLLDHIVIGHGTYRSILEHLGGSF